MTTLDDRLLLPPLPDLSLQATLETLSDKKKECETLIKIMQEWKNILSSYSKKMSDLAETLNKLSSEKKSHSSHSSSKQIFENLWYLMNIVSIQSRNLVLKIDDDMITEAKETVKKMAVDFNNPSQLERSRRKSLLGKRKVIEQTYGVLMERKRALEDATTNKFITEHCINSNLEKRIKVSKKVTEEEAEFNLTEFKLRDTISDYNSQLLTWESESAQSIKSMREIQNSYSKIIMDLYMKAQLHRSTEYKTVLHELERIAEKNIQLSVRAEEDQENVESWQQAHIQDFDSFLLRSVKMIDDKSIEELTYYSKNKEIKQAIRGSKTLEQGTQRPKQLETRSRSESESSNPAKYYENLSKFFTQCLQGQPTQEQLQKFQRLLINDQKRRIDFISIFQKYRIEGRCHMKSSKRRAKKILEIFLNICLKANDGFCCRLIMVLLFTYFFIKREETPAPLSLSSSLMEIGKDESSRESSREFSIAKDLAEEQPQSVPQIDFKKEQRSVKESEKIYLQILVQDHPIWKRLDYWESVLVECIYEEMVGHRRGSRGSLSQDNMLETSEEENETLRNIVFSQLLAISCNMKLLGCQQKEISSFILKFCKLFGLGSQRVKEIEKSLVPTRSESSAISLEEMLRE